MSLSLNFLHMGMSVKEVAARFMGIYEAQFEGLRQAGATVTFSLETPDPSADFIICTSNAADIQLAASQTTKPLILYMPPIDQWFDRELLAHIKHRILFAYGPSLSGMTEDAYLQLGIPYHFLPFAADPNVMRPLNLTPQFDIAFLGGLRHRRGYQPYIDPLIRTLDPTRLAFIGGGWEQYGISIRNVGGLSANHPGYPENGPLINNFYNLARVCINLHAPEQTRGAQLQLDCNNRVFDLAMAGCVQVSDNPDAVRMHFDAGEVLAEATSAAWVQRVLECLRQPQSTFAAMRHAARARALAEHTWFHRGQTFLSWIHSHSPH